MTSKKTCIYKPNAVTAENGDVKKVSFGGLFGSNYHKVPRNKVAALTWEAPQLLTPGKKRKLLKLTFGV